MAKGVVHKTWWLRFLPFSLIISICLSTISSWFGIMTAIGYLMGNYIEPDLDQPSLTRSEGDMMRKFGCFGMAWVMYWFPYAYFIRHRSPISHCPGLSDALRMLYIGWWIIPITIYYDVTLRYEAVLGIWFGLTLSTTIHWILDK